MNELMTKNNGMQCVASEDSDQAASFREVPRTIDGQNCRAVEGIPMGVTPRLLNINLKGLINACRQKGVWGTPPLAL